MMFGRHKTEMPAPDDALRGRDDRMPVAPAHFVNGATLTGTFSSAGQVSIGLHASNTQGTDDKTLVVTVSTALALPGKRIDATWGAWLLQLADPGEVRA